VDCDKPYRTSTTAQLLLGNLVGEKQASRCPIPLLIQHRLIWKL
jgi:hypothetical protein